MTDITIGILAHVDAGKTTLCESILFDTGAIRSMGRVDKGDSFFDTDEMERERGITIFSKQAVFELPGDFSVTLMDTPGHADFSPEAERTLWVLDYAVLVISAADGVSGRSRALFDLLSSYNVPVFTFVNKMDQPGSDRTGLLLSLKEKLDGMYVDFTEPGSESFFEDIAVADEALMEEYLSTGSVEKDRIKKLIKERRIFPVCFGSALRNDGVNEFLRVISEYMEAPDLPPRDEFSARVFKITRDEKGARLTHIKVMSGHLGVREPFGEDEKVTEIRVYSGDRYDTINDTSVGGIYAITGPQKIKGGTGIGGEENAPGACMTPVMTYRLNPPQGTDPLSMMKKLEELTELMPELQAIWDEELREIHVSIMGSVQLEILTKLIKEKYDEDVTFGAGRIVYKETIADIVEGVGHFEPLRHYAEVHLKLEPAERGSGITVELDTPVDELALNWQRLIETHLLERRHRGVLTGSVITDIKFTVIGGKAHLKHTMGGDFRQATYRAVRQGLMQAGSVLLEPYYDLELTVPEDCIGRAMTDLDKNGAVFSPPVSEGGFAVLRGKAPAACMQDYPTAVAAYTGGRGSISLSFSGYDICHNAEEVIDAMGYDPESDLRNTPDSVFCSHGAGTVVPWDQVFEHMHVPAKLSFDENGEYLGMAEVDEAAELMEAAKKARSEHLSRVAAAGSSPAMGYEEVDRIVYQAQGANAGSSNRKKNAGWKGIRRNAGKETDVNRAKTRVFDKPALEKRMLIDGYNLIYATPDLKELAKENIDSARLALIDMVSNYGGLTDAKITLVFDAYRVDRPKSEPVRHHNLDIVYTQRAQSADAYIEKYTHENSSRYDITVVTSDGLEQISVRGAGCRLISSTDFQLEMKKAMESAGKYMGA